jgi:dynein heavy chain
VLNGSQVLWTKEVEEAIRSGQVPAYFEKLQVQLDNLVDLVRTKLTKQQKVTLNALIVIDVHAKDVIENIKKVGAEDVTAFEWIS